MAAALHTSDPPEGEIEADMRRRLSWLMVGRLVVATLLLGGTLALAINQEQGAQGYTPRFLLSMIVATYAASLGFALWLPRARRLTRFGTLQIGWDVGITTALVYTSGGVSSGFTFLYGISVLMAALVIGPRAARLCTAVSLLAYSALSLSLVGGVLAPPLDQPLDRYLMDGPDATFTILVNILGLLLVSVLATTLAQRLRRAGGQLREASAQAAGLAQLNESIVRSLTSGLVTTDRSLRVRTINSAGLYIFHATSERVLDQPLEDFIQHAQLAQQGTLRAEGVGLRDDGSVYPIGFTKTDLIDGRGTRTGHLVVFQDLSEITELREAAERAERLAALGRVAAALAHEIRNPLGAISGSVELVAESQDLHPEDQKLLSIVVKEVDRLNELVHTMLDLSQPSKPLRTPVDLAGLAREVAHMATRDQRLPAGVSITLDVPDQPLMADVDGGKLRQLLWNLLKNALQHSPSPGEVRIVVMANGPDVQVEVIDQGPGVPDSARPRLFDMFFSKRQHGIGLGLSLCKQIVDAHGGSIEVHRAQPGGSRFVARVPRQVNSAPDSRP